MHITRTTLLLVALLGGAISCFAQTGTPSAGPPPPALEYNPNAWKEFVSQEGGFSVRMPAEPKLNRQEVDTAMGKMPISFYTAVTGTGGYMAGYTDFPMHSEEPQFINAVLDGARDNVLASDANRKLLSEKAVTREGFPAREWLIADKLLLLRAETFLAKGRLYQMLFIAPLNVAFNNGRASVNAADRTVFYEEICRKFFGSFKLLPGSATTEGTAQTAPAPNVETKDTPNEARPQGEVGRLLRSLREKGEMVMGVCEEGTECKPLPDVEGFKAGDKDRVTTIKVINKPPPVYPPIAKAAHAQGPVRVQVLVDEEGKVIAAEAISGHPLLQAAAVQAARKVRLTPILLGTTPVKVSGVIVYNFILQ